MERAMEGNMVVAMVSRSKMCLKIWSSGELGAASLLMRRRQRRVGPRVTQWMAMFNIYWLAPNGSK